MIALLDSDILVYRVGFASENEPYELAEARLNETIERILHETKADGYKCYLTAANDSTAFRKQIYPEYKGHRKQPKPVHYQALREFLVSTWDAEVVSVIEADDALGIEQINNTEETVICSIDKDLDMIPGMHYNFVKNTLYKITSEDAIYNFYRQLLTGDTADNIKGARGIGPKKAEKILAGCEEEEEMFDRVREVYGNDQEMLINGECLWILREPFPTGRWSWSIFGSRLKQEDISQLELDLQQTPHSMVSAGWGTLRDGCPSSGHDLQDATD